MKAIFPTLLCLLFLSCAKEETKPEPGPSPSPERTYHMGFTSWPYGPNLEDVDNTYAFLNDHGDIYAEHIDNKIPWNAWINDLTLPEEFSNEISGKANRRIPNKELLLSVSLLQSNREELASDFDGSTPAYSQLDDEHIKQAYYKHIRYLIEQFNPNYLVIAIEVNELRLHSPEKWTGYTNLIHEVKTNIGLLYPELPIAESISLHNLYQSNIPDAQAYVEDIMAQVNQNDFLAISFYPFLKNLHSQAEIQEALDFLHAEAQKPIAFVETAQLAEDLIIPNLNVSIAGNETGQNTYLESLLENARQEDYRFIIWWAHRDFDALWATFPEEIRDLGQIWRDTGLLDEAGVERPAYSTWSEAFSN